MQTVKEYTADIIDNFEKRMANKGHSDKIDPFWIHGLKYHAGQIDEELKKCDLEGIIAHSMRFGFNQHALALSMHRKGVEEMSGDLMFNSDIITKLVARELWNNCNCTRN
ncbi:hypothetical protein LCGC14_3169200 [marine sediment metagenome]|uniref:Uncharacterized protein n=1 Tax=marine sediment metagenome TaxID=412755 RepID=A0A0F8VEQ4_9ZZZZ